MIIAYPTTTAIPGIKASSVHIAKMASAFASNGHEVTLLAAESPRRITCEDPFRHYGVAPSFKIEYFPLLRRWGLLHPLTLLARRASVSKRLRGLQPDLVYSRDLNESLCAASLGLPTIFETHAFPEAFSSGPQRRMLPKLIKLPAFQGMVVITHTLKQLYVQTGALAPEQIFVAPDAADPLQHSLPPAGWSPPEGRLQVGYVGSMYPGRGTKLVASLASRHPEMDFHLIGGPAELASQFRERNTAPNLYVLGYLAPAEAMSRQRAFDILLAPYGRAVSTASGKDTTSIMSPMKIFEYMATGKPMIASDLPVLREVLSSENCMLAAPDSLEEWDRALCALRDQPELRQRLGHYAKKQFLSRHTWRQRTEAILKHHGFPAFGTCADHNQGPSILALGNAQNSHMTVRVQHVAERLKRTTFMSARPGLVKGVEVIAPRSPRKLPGPFSKLSTYISTWLHYTSIRDFKADIVHVHFAYSKQAWLALAAGRSPLVITTMGADILLDERTEHPFAGDFLTRLVLRNADLVTVKTEKMRNAALSMGVTSGNIQKVVWGIDPDFFTPDGPDMRAALDIPKDSVVVLSPRTATPEYNIKLIVTLFAELYKTRKNLVLLMAWGGSEEPYLSEVKLLVSELGLDLVTRYVGFISFQDMPSLYRTSDVVVSMAHLTEGLPQTLIESMACGVPALMPDLGRIKEFAPEGMGATYVPIEKSSALERLAKLVDEVEFRESLAAAGLDLVLKNANIRHEAERVAERLKLLWALKRKKTSLGVRILAGIGIFANITAYYLSNLLHRFAPNERR